MRLLTDQTCCTLGHMSNLSLSSVRWQNTAAVTLNNNQVPFHTELAAEDNMLSPHSAWAVTTTLLSQQLETLSDIVIT